MTDFAVGKTGMPVTNSPVRILRPGDPGFPKEHEETTDMGGITKKTRRCAMCGSEYVPTGNAQKRCPACMAKRVPPTKPKGEKPSTAAKAIAKLRRKGVPPPVVPPPALTATADLRAIAASYRQAADLLDQAADLLAPAA